jgi:hypothetical protein
MQKCGQLRQAPPGGISGETFSGCGLGYRMKHRIVVKAAHNHPDILKLPARCSRSLLQARKNPRPGTTCLRKQIFIGPGLPAYGSSICQFVSVPEIRHGDKPGYF